MTPDDRHAVEDLLAAVRDTIDALHQAMPRLATSADRAHRARAQDAVARMAEDLRALLVESARL